jgi:hypothetical protein
MTEYQPICEAERRLGLSYINIAHRGVKSHPGKMVNDHLALVLFDRYSSKETTVALWRISTGEAVTSKNLPFQLGMLWDWDWRAQAVEKAFEELLTTLQPTTTIASELEHQITIDQLKQGAGEAIAMQLERGGSVHPRILEARSNGSNV